MGLMRNKTSFSSEAFDCVACGSHVVPMSYRDRPLNYHPDLIADGRAKPGPHCRRCADKNARASVMQWRAKAFQHEAERQARFVSASKPEGMSEHLWSAMRSYACCPSAERNGCVCAYSFTCSEHGTIHVGTHD